ncbi:MAG: DUF1223 domain-containing protein [Sphingomonadales bacterium]|nr:DUF1223 domain-containing protein [Sphingomonadales bacterium]
MRPLPILLASCVALAAWLGLHALPGMAADTPREPVVVELFTSQGCSSCPPADVLAAKLAKEPGFVVISRPVTYWDRLGWKDTLAREENTRLQRAYGARGFDGQGVYTPQVVLDGRAGAIGSQEANIRQIAARLPHKGQAAIALETLPDGTTIAGLGGTSAMPAELVLLEIDPLARVAIGSGENGGRKIAYANVVRGEKRLVPWNGGKASVRIASSERRGAEAGRRQLLLLRETDGGPILAARWL